MKVVLAEKPSVGRDIASALGVKSRRDGYYEGRGYQITWSFGHIFTLKEPSEYDLNYKSWSLSTLPITPNRFELKLIDDAGNVFASNGALTANAVQTPVYANLQSNS